MSLVKIEDALKKVQERGIDAQLAVSKHKTASSYMRLVDSASKNIMDRGVSAELLNNFSKIMDSDFALGATHAGDFGPFVQEVWPLVTAWYPNFPLKDLISVQSMDKPLGYLVFSMLRAGTTKGDTALGDIVETALGARKLKGKYPTGEIFGEEILDNQITDNGTLLAYAPLNVSTIPGYLDKTIVTIGSDVYQAYNTNGNKLLFKKAGAEQADSVISIDIQTGALSGTAVVAKKGVAGTKAISVNYVRNLDYAEADDIMKVKEQVELRPMEATPRALMLEWTLFSEYLKKSQFGIDIREDNTRRILDLMYQYQVRYILDEMYMYRDQVANADVAITAQTSTGVSLEVINQRVQKQLKAVAGKILKASGRCEGNRLVVGLDFKNWVESLPENLFKPTVNDDAYMLSPHEIGTYGTFKVYFDPELADNAYWMTYRGKEWCDAAYYLGEYMPIVPTDCISLAVNVRASFVSMEAYRFDKKNCVIGGTFTEA